MERRDLDPVFTCLPLMTVITSIQFTGEAFQEVSKQPNISASAVILGSSVPNKALKPSRKPPNPPNPWDKTASMVVKTPSEVKLSRWPGVVVKLMKSLALNMQSTLTLSELRLVGLKVGKIGWKALAEGFVSSCPMEFLAINYCKMDDNALEFLTPGLKTLLRLRKIDLSNNQLSDRCGFFLSRLINMHGIRKDEISWLNNLRSGMTTPASAPLGLQEICIANNKISDKSIFDLCHALSFDAWMQVLDLRRNPISEEGIREILSMIQSNTSLLYVDIRETGLRDPHFTRKMFQKLRKNLNNARCSLSAKRAAEFYEKLKEAEMDTSRIVPERHVESVSFPNADLTREIQEEDMLGSYLSESPKDCSGVKKALCPQCRKMERQLLRSESQCVALKLANRSLRSSIRPGSRGETPHRRIEVLMAELSELIENMEET